MNRVGSEGAGAIGAAVAACPMLRAVDMSQNFLQDEGILNLAELLAAQGRPTSGALERLGPLPAPRSVLCDVRDRHIV
eukprot:3725171-Rhodomonas_salina.2